MRRHLSADELAWAEPHLDRIGALMGGPVAERAEETDRNPPRLERYDRWGHDISEVVMPASFLDVAPRRARQQLHDAGDPRRRRRRAASGSRMLGAAHSYMLDQAEIGMACALGTGGDMVVQPGRVSSRPPTSGSASWTSSRPASGPARPSSRSPSAPAAPTSPSWRRPRRPTATHGGINGFKWFASNANGAAWVVLAKPEGAPDSARGIATFLVLRERRDGSRNGIRIRRLKDKLGTKAVASAEVEFVDAEAFLLSGARPTATRARATARAWRG